jgi:pyruvate,water dikinase
MVGANARGDLLIWLDGRAVGRELVGGKGASLSRLVGLGAPVPPAFALSTHAYSAMARAAGVPHRASETLDADLPALRDRIAGAPIPADVRAELAAGFQRLSGLAGADLAMAVRSSATAEDSAAFSFAGLHDTILDVRDLAGLELAVKRCWASLWTERAVAYRRQGSLATDEAAIAVVVQQLVRSDVSFVAFTADPVSGARDRLVIDAAYGLGESIVSGSVTPDHIEIGPDGTVAAYQIGEKAEMVIPGADGSGTRTVPVPRMLRELPALAAEHVESIAAMARNLAARLGYPADLEGGVASGRIALFQVRPITTLQVGAV